MGDAADRAAQRRAEAAERQAERQAERRERQAEHQAERRERQVEHRAETAERRAESDERRAASNGFFAAEELARGDIFGAVTRGVRAAWLAVSAKNQRAAAFGDDPIDNPAQKTVWAHKQSVSGLFMGLLKNCASAGLGRRTCALAALPSLACSPRGRWIETALRREAAAHHAPISDDRVERGRGRRRQGLPSLGRC